MKFKMAKVMAITVYMYTVYMFSIMCVCTVCMYVLYFDSVFKMTVRVMNGGVFLGNFVKSLSESYDLPISAMAVGA